jgi:hypothetical protein
MSKHSSSVWPLSGALMLQVPPIEQLKDEKMADALARVKVGRRRLELRGFYLFAKSTGTSVARPRR